MLKCCYRIGFWIGAGVSRVDPFEHLEGGIGLAALQQKLGALGESEQPQAKHERWQGTERDEEVPGLEVKRLAHDNEVHGDDQPGDH